MVLFSFLSFAVLGAVLANAAPKPDPPIRLTLDYAFTQAGKKFWGAAADPRSLNASNNERLITVQYGQITPAQSFDWAITEPRPGVFNFDNADYMVKWAVNNRKVIRAGPLLSHSSIPPWVSNLTSRDEMAKAIDSHISALVSRYKDVVYAWDVISEPFNEDGSFRGAPFYDVLGLNYFRIALNAARRSDPKAKLYINDYNMDDDNPKTHAMAKVVLKLNSESASLLPVIDGIGTYVYLRQRQPGYGSVPTALKILSEATVDLALTQLYVPNAPEIGYLTIVRGCLAVSRCISITNHQPSDWTPGIIVPEVYTGSLFDYSGNPKSTYKAVVDYLLTTDITPART